MNNPAIFQQQVKKHSCSARKISYLQDERCVAIAQIRWVAAHNNWCRAELIHTHNIYNIVRAACCWCAFCRRRAGTSARGVRVDWVKSPGMHASEWASEASGEWIARVAPGGMLRNIEQQTASAPFHTLSAPLPPSGDWAMRWKKWNAAATAHTLAAKYLIISLRCHQLTLPVAPRGRPGRTIFFDDPPWPIISLIN